MRPIIHRPAALLLPLLLTAIAGADPVPVRHPAGTLHGLLRMETLDGKPLATGDLIQTVRGTQITTHLLFKFRDGSVDDETTVFTQGGTLKMVSDHHIQKGPNFPQQMDFTVTNTGEVNAHTTEKDGKESTVKQHMDLPADLANGLPLQMVLNLTENDAGFKVPLLALDTKPIMVKLEIRPDGFEEYTVNGNTRRANRYVVRPEIGGLKGLLAPAVGKQPKEYRLWIAGGEAPVFLRSEGQLYNGGPLVRIEQASAHFASSEAAH